MPILTLIPAEGGWACSWLELYRGALARGDRGCGRCTRRRLPTITGPCLWPLPPGGHGLDATPNPLVDRRCGRAARFCHPGRVARGRDVVFCGVVSMGAELPGEVWTPARRDLRDQLGKLDPALGALYGHALNRLHEAAAPGEEQARIVLIAHSVREMTNNLPEALADVDGVPVGRADTSGPCQKLVAEWDKHADILDPMPSVGSVDERVTVPASVLLAASRVVVSQRGATGNRRLRQSAVALRRLELGKDPTLTMWLDVLTWFESHAHLDKSRGRPVPEDEVVLTKLEIIETILSARLRGFFNVMADLAAIAELANRSANP
jgi:hypothetical protein